MSPGAPALRPYQRAAVDAVLAARRRGVRRMVVCLPTGAGKTVIFSHLARLARRQVLVLAHREELLFQAKDKKDCLILDFADLSSLQLCTLPSLFGMPRDLDDPRGVGEGHRAARGAMSRSPRRLVACYAAPNPNVIGSHVGSRAGAAVRGGEGA